MALLLSKKLTRQFSKSQPSYQEELSLINQGFHIIAGLDEAGRGPLAGPVVAGVAILPHNHKGEWVRLIRDSKQLTRKQREDALSHLEKVALGLGTGTSSAKEIDDLGIVLATRVAMKRALDSLLLQPDFLLLDAFPLPEVSTPQKAIKHGDALCLSIAAASIIAKVTRDKEMEAADACHPGYGFAKNKGYPTPEHLLNLARLGPSPIHRMTFAPLKAVNTSP